MGLSRGMAAWAIPLGEPRSAHVWLSLLGAAACVQAVLAAESVSRGSDGLGGACPELCKAQAILFPRALSLASSSAWPSSTAPS